MVKKTCGGGVPAAASNVASHPVHLRRWAGAAANSNTHGTYPAQPNMPRRSERQVGRPATSATGRSRRTDMCPIPRGCNSSRRVQSTTCRAKTVVKLQRHQRVRRDHASLARLCNGYGLTRSVGPGPPTIPPSVTDSRAATLPPAFIDVRRNAIRRITDEFFRAPQSFKVQPT